MSKLNIPEITVYSILSPLPVQGPFGKENRVKEMTLMVLLHGPPFFPKTSETVFHDFFQTFHRDQRQGYFFHVSVNYSLSPTPTPHLVFVSMCPVPPLSLVSLLFLCAFTEISNRTPELSVVTSFWHLEPFLKDL